MVALALTGCSTSSKSSAPTSGGQADRADGAVAPGAPAPLEGGKVGAPPAAAPTNAPTAGVARDHLHRFDHHPGGQPQEQATRVSAIAKSVVGGYVSADDRTVNDQQSIAQITLRVPAGDFAETVSAISNLGKEIDRKVSTQDVTAQVIDVTSRVKTQQASVDRVRILLNKATSINEIVSLESELTRREADLESLESQLANLTDLTSLSTVTATLLGPVAATKTTETKKDSGFIAGLKSGWHTFVSSVNVPAPDPRRAAAVPGGRRAGGLDRAAPDPGSPGRRGRRPRRRVRQPPADRAAGRRTATGLPGTGPDAGLPGPGRPAAGRLAGGRLDRHAHRREGAGRVLNTVAPRLTGGAAPSVRNRAWPGRRARCAP